MYVVKLLHSSERHMSSEDDTRSKTTIRNNYHLWPGTPTK